MYSGCSEMGCRKKSRYLIDMVKNGEYYTYSRCRDHSGDDELVVTRKDIHDVIIPLSQGGSPTRFKAGCSTCSDKNATEIIRFKDGFGVVSTESRCSQCIEKIVDSRREVVSRKAIKNVDIRAEDCN